MNEDVIITPAEDDDMRDVWEWRNHLEVRRNSFNTAVVSWEGHQQWFKQRRADPRCRIYIARRSGDKIGVIRFEPDGDHMLVSVHLNPAYLGQGLGARVIRAGTQHFLAEKGTQMIIARIIKGNEASVKAFAKAGYRCADQNPDVVTYQYSTGF